MAQNNFVDFDQAKALANKVAQRFNEQSAGLIFKGSKTFATLPSTLTQAMAGYFYNMSESFTTDSRFVEGSGKTYPAGTNVSVADCSTYEAVVDPFGDPSSQDWYELVNNKYVLSTDTEVDPNKTYYVGTISMKFDVASGFIDVESINDRIDDVGDDIAEQFSTSETYKAGDIVMYNDLLYKFKTDHSAGAWNSAEVDATNIASELSENQNAFTSGDYLEMANGVLNVTKNKGNDLYSYKFITTSTSDWPRVKIQRYINGVFQSEETYNNDDVRTNPVTLDGLFTFTYGVDGYRWQYTLLANSHQHNAGEVVKWMYNVSVDSTESFDVVPQDTSKNLVLQEDLDAALADKQDTLTAGNYIAIESNAIRVNRTLTNPTIPYTYRVHTTSTDGTYASVDIDKKDESGVVIDSVSIWFYEHQGIANAVTMDDFIQIYYDNHWICNLLKNSTTHQAGYQQSWNWNQSVDFNEVYDMEVDLSGKKLIIKDEMDTALSGKQDTLTFDSVPTDGSTNPVESNGVYDALATKANASDVTTALATKQDATDNNLQTTSKTVVGGINELKSGLTDLSEEVNGDSTTYPYADVITIEDAVPSNLADCSVKIEPVQDLHGYSQPWVGGAGKNKCPNKTYKANSYTLYVGQDDDTSFPFALVGGTTYTLSFVCELSPILIYLREENAASGTLVNNTFTPSASGNYRIAISVDGIDTTNVSNIQLELGSSATDYEPYSNICPISGHTEASVTVDRNNLFDKSSTTTGTINGSNGTEGTSSNWEKSGQIYVNPNYQYTLSVDAPMGSNSAGLAFYDSDNSYISGIVYSLDDWSETNGRYYKTLTSPSNAAYVKLSCKPNDESKLMFARGTATAYTPYVTPHTATITFGETVYGGTVDFDSGVMTVDRAIVDLGDFTWENDYAPAGMVRTTTGISGALNPPNNATKADMVSDRYMVLPYYVNGEKGVDSCSTNGALGIATAFNNSIGIRDMNLANMTPSDIKTAVTGYKLLYKLATPFTVQLTPQQIQLLKGTNTLTASTGQISITVNGVAGSIGQVQEQVNELAEDVANLHYHKVAESAATGTRADKLASLYSTYNTLKNDVRKSAILLRNNADIFHAVNNGGAFSSVYLDANTLVIIGISLNPGSFVVNSNGTTTDGSSTENAEVYSLWIIE